MTRAEALYLFEPNSFVPLASIQDDKTYWYHCDQIGAPQEVTDAEGQIVWAADYEVWGEVKLRRTGTSGCVDFLAKPPLPTIEQPFRFQGQQFDDETGLHYNRFRYYDPGVGRFVSQDPIGSLGGVNLFYYAENPFDSFDPWGLKKIVNKVNGDRREAEAKRRVQAECPNCRIQTECYLRDANGKSVKDGPNGRRRLDMVVIDSQGKVSKAVEVTSLAADKRLQIAKEVSVRQQGGVYIRDRCTGQLLRVEQLSEIMRIE